MKTAALVAGLMLAIPGHLSAGTATTAPPDLQGTWVYTDLVVEGEPAPPPQLEAARLIVTGFDVLFVAAGVAYHGFFTAERTTEPWMIDLHFTSGPQEGEAALGIWRLDDGYLTLCLGLVGRPRPDDFTALPGSGRSLQILTQDPRVVVPPAVGPLPPR